MKVKAYAIFDGGGVLGAALAGCLKASEDFGIQFVGFGGTSAGSIIATLGAVGMDGSAIQEAIVERPFGDFLEDGGRPVGRFLDRLGRLGDAAEGFRWWNSPWRAARVLQHASTAARMLGDRLGVDDGRALRGRLHELIADRQPQWHPDRCSDVTFGMLEAGAGCFPLKIVASDVTKRRPVVFGGAGGESGESVLGAVRASTCYPFVFRPAEVGRRRLVDGGLTSNLPAALFRGEQARNGFPAFAFDLVDEVSDPPATYGLKSYVKDMMATAIDAGDALLRDSLEGVDHVPVPIPGRFGVLDFAINRERREELFNIGYVATMTYLQKSDLLRELVGLDAESVQRGLQVRYGEPALYEPVLAALARDVERTSKAENVRVTIMLPTSRETRVVVYSHGMVRRRSDGSLTHDPDSDLEIPEDAGASGRAWSSGRPVLADLVEARRVPSEWGMTALQAGKLPDDRLAMLSLPIPRFEGPGDPADSDPRDRNLGTLTLDSSTPLAYTSWVEEGSASGPRREVVELIHLWLAVIQRLLLFNE